LHYYFPIVNWFFLVIDKWLYIGLFMEYSENADYVLYGGKRSDQYHTYGILPEELVNMLWFLNPCKTFQLKCTLFDEGTIAFSAKRVKEMQTDNPALYTNCYRLRQAFFDICMQYYHHYKT